MLPASLACHTWARTIPPELSDRAKDGRFLFAQLAQDDHCRAGVISYGAGGPSSGCTNCVVSINECLGVPGATVRQSYKGWIGIFPATQRQRSRGAGIALAVSAGKMFGRAIDVVVNNAGQRAGVALTPIQHVANKDPVLLPEHTVPLRRSLRKMTYP